MELSRPEYWSGSPFPSSGDLPNPGEEPRSPALQADSLPSEPPGKPYIHKAHRNRMFCVQPGGFGFSFCSLRSSLVSLLASLPLPPIPPCSLFSNSRKNTGQSHLHTSCFCAFAYVVLLARMVSLSAPQPTLVNPLLFNSGITSSRKTSLNGSALVGS